MRLEIHAKPGSKKPGIDRITETRWIVRVREPPAEGKANMAILKAVARELGIPPSALNLVRGASTKIKWIDIPDSLLE